MFRSPFHDHLQGSPLVLSASTTFQMPASSFVFFGFVAVCPLFVCVPGVPVCVLSGRERPDNTQTGTPGTHTNRGIPRVYSAEVYCLNSWDPNCTKSNLDMFYSIGLMS
jgi:hypothetical protein